MDAKTARIINSIFLGYSHKKSVVFVKYSEFALALLHPLEQIGVIGSFHVVPNRKGLYWEEIQIKLTYTEKASPPITAIKLPKKSSYKDFVTLYKMEKEANFQSIIIVSTNKGIITSDVAIKKRVGGLLVCTICY